MHFACVKAFSAFDRGDYNLGRAEQHGLDGVEVALETLEKLGKRSAEVARRPTRKRVRETLRLRGRPGDIELRASAVDDRVVSAAHSGDKVRMRRTEGPSAHAVEDALERKLELMGLVQRHFQHPRNHLRRPS